MVKIVSVKAIKIFRRLKLGSVVATRSIVVAARPVIAVVATWPVVVTSRPIVAVAWSVVIIVVVAVSSCNLVLAWKLVAIIGVVIVAKQPSRPTNWFDIERIEYP